MPEPPSRSGASHYEPVVEHDAYRAVNRRLLGLGRIEGLAPGAVVVDLGGGTGALAAEVLTTVPSATVWVVDPDDGMLRDAKVALGDRARIARGTAEGVEELFGPEQVDRVLMGNCVHLVDDIGAAFGSIHRILAPDGVLTFNTAFFVGAEDPGERHLYWEVALAARHRLRAGAATGSRRVARPLAKRRLSEDGYRTLLSGAGLAVEDVVIETVTLDLAMVLDIVGAPVFATGALPGVDPDRAREVLTDVTREVIGRRGVEVIRRRWMSVVATKVRRDRGEVP